MRDILDRFFSKFKEGSPEDCWIWEDHINIYSGYGHFFTRGKKKVGAHVFAFEFFNKKEAKHDVHHTCEDKRCVNPGHLVDITRSQHLKLHNKFCKKGHLLTDENSYKTIFGRKCKLCVKIYNKNNR